MMKEMWVADFFFCPFQSPFIHDTAVENIMLHGDHNGKNGKKHPLHSGVRRAIYTSAFLELHGLPKGWWFLFQIKFTIL